MPEECSSEYDGRCHSCRYLRRVKRGTNDAEVLPRCHPPDGYPAKSLGDLNRVPEAEPRHVGDNQITMCLSIVAPDVLKTNGHPTLWPRLIRLPRHVKGDFAAAVCNVRMAHAWKPRGIVELELRKPWFTMATFPCRTGHPLQSPLQRD